MLDFDGVDNVACFCRGRSCWLERNLECLLSFVFQCQDPKFALGPARKTPYVAALRLLRQGLRIYPDEYCPWMVFGESSRVLERESQRSVGVLLRLFGF